MAGKNVNVQKESHIMLNNPESSLVTTKDELLGGDCTVIVPIFEFSCTAEDGDDNRNVKGRTTGFQN
jgi:hypothetical protein